MSGLGFEVLVILILIFGNGVFALAEIALVSARKHRLQQRADEGSHRATIALDLASKPNELLSTVQVGITLIGILSGAFGGALVAENLAEKLNSIRLISPHGQSVAITLVVLVITILTIILGELVPKRLALTNPEMYAAAMAPIMKMVSKIAFPAVRMLSWSTDQMLKLLPTPRSEEKEIVEEEIKVLIEQGTETGAFEETEQEMVEGVFELGDRRVVNLMRPRKKIVWIDINGDPDDIQKTILNNSYSRYPVAEENPDHMLGYVHVKDLLGQCMKGQPIDLRSSIRKLPAMPEIMTALKALETFKESGTHIAVIVNEYGATEGLITLNDIVEAIVGDLPAVGEKPEQWAKQREDGSWLIEGSAPIFELKDLLGINTLPGEDEYAYTTLGGFILMQLGRIPSPAEHFESDGWRYEVVDMDDNRIDKVLVSKLPDPQKTSEE
jgi:putative hemolysin